MPIDSWSLGLWRYLMNFVYHEVPEVGSQLIDGTACRTCPFMQQGLRVAALRSSGIEVALQCS